MTMTIKDWMAAARARIVSGKMTESEWEAVLYSLLYASEDEDRGLGDFDDAIMEAEEVRNG